VGTAHRVKQNGILSHMPELPELEVVCEVLRRRVVGQTIDTVKLIQPGAAIVVRDLTASRFEVALAGATIETVARRGKFLLFGLQPARNGHLHPLPGRSAVLSNPLQSDGFGNPSGANHDAYQANSYLAINPKLTGRLQLAAPTDKKMSKTHLIFSLSGGIDLRYVDQKTMGQLYLTTDLAQVPDYASLGPEPFDVSLDQFRERLRPYRGEIKGVLVRGEFIAGIGNAYADEILWAAKIHPYRKRTALTPDEIERLYDAMQATLHDAIDKVRAEMGEAIHREPRDFMAIHMKSGQPCPRCGTTISQVSANQRITNFCRTCQPGGLIKGM
jgi:formamidopyrimidine-DNA glycosylase